MEREQTMSDFMKPRSGEERRGLTVVADVVIAIFLLVDAYLFFEDDSWVKSSLVRIHHLVGWQLMAFGIFLLFRHAGVHRWLHERWQGLSQRLSR